MLDIHDLGVILLLTDTSVNKRTKWKGEGEGGVMSSYIYMKILESQPKRYDRGIALLSFGQADRARERLVTDNVAQHSRVLDLGCGTGTAAILAARAGARVTGVDISAPMLAVARQKVEAAALGDRIELIEQGIAGMDRFADASFDVIIATLVFSELSPDEQAYALDHAVRILGPGGRLAIADEVRPTTPGKKLLHGIARLPLLAVTFALTQTTTHAVEGLPERIQQRGLRVLTEELSALDSFLYLVASREEA
jgi:demethylmenaquinone methyltransferase/2-methoxy-6-polyprenyl-1,4-benzoquinol methylase